MNEEEGEQILQGVNEKMRRKEGEKAEIPSSGFSLKPLVKVNEGCMQSSETDYITAPLINIVSLHLSPVHLHVRVCVSAYASTLVQLGVLNLSLTRVHQRNVLASVYMRVPACARAASLTICQDVTSSNSRGKADGEDDG